MAVMAVEGGVVEVTGWMTGPRPIQKAALVAGGRLQVKAVIQPSSTRRRRRDDGGDWWRQGERFRSFNRMGLGADDGRMTVMR
jgi:hypothetical protein